MHKTALATGLTRGSTRCLRARSRDHKGYGATKQDGFVLLVERSLAVLESCHGPSDTADLSDLSKRWIQKLGASSGPDCILRVWFFPGPVGNSLGPPRRPSSSSFYSLLVYKPIAGLDSSNASPSVLTRAPDRSST